MVSVCSGCNVFHPLSAGLLGIIAGSLYLVTSATMIKIQVDDPVDAVAVHAGSGFLSIILTPLFRYYIPYVIFEFTRFLNVLVVASMIFQRTL